MRERKRESIFETHTSTHTICVWMRYIPVLRYMFSPTLPNSLLLLSGLWPLRQVLAHFCATLASSELHFCITDTKKFTLTKYHKKWKKNPQNKTSPGFLSSKASGFRTRFSPGIPETHGFFSATCWEQYNGEITRGFRRRSSRHAWCLICYNLFVPWI